jgi:hypothetical protein
LEESRYKRVGLRAVMVMVEKALGAGTKRMHWV